MLDGIRWILFDAVGTLIYPDPPVADVYHAAGETFGSRLGKNDICRRFQHVLAAEYAANKPTNEANERQRWQRIVATVLDDLVHDSGDVFEHLWRHFAQPQHWRLFDDVLTALNEFHHSDFRLGIASNFDARLHNIIAGLPGLELCEAVFVSSEVGFVKPDPGFYAAVQLRIGAAPSQIALVGDDPIADFQGATAAGWRAILLDRSGAILPPAIRSLSELLA